MDSCRLEDVIRCCSNIEFERGIRKCLARRFSLQNVSTLSQRGACEVDI